MLWSPIRMQASRVYLDSSAPWGSPVRLKVANSWFGVMHVPCTCRNGMALETVGGHSEQDDDVRTHTQQHAVRFSCGG
jgi:hypothetical protein